MGITVIRGIPAPENRSLRVVHQFSPRGKQGITRITLFHAMES